MQIIVNFNKSSYTSLIYYYLNDHFEAFTQYK